jgi:P-type Cu+ transporter
MSASAQLSDRRLGGGDSQENE